MDRKHTTKYMVNGQWFEKEKIAYETDKEAIEKAREMNLRPQTIRKVVAYKCDTCHKWHIGRTSKCLTEKDREHYRKAGGEYNFKPVTYIDDVKKVVLSTEQDLILKRNLGLC